MNRLLRYLVPLLLSLAVAHGQNGRKIQFRTLCLEHSGDLTELAMAGKEPGSSIPIPLYTSSISPVTEAVIAGEEVLFFAKDAELTAEKKPPVMARARLGRSARQLFLFVPAKPGAKIPYDVRVFPDDTADFKLGTIRAINLSPVAVRFIVSGATSPSIPPGKHAMFPQSAKVDDFNMYPVAVEFLSANDQWVKSYSTSWKASDQRREIVVTMIDSRFRQPVVKMFSDIPVWPKSETP